VTVTDQAFSAWVVADGRYLAWSGPDGNGGEDDEGQGLHLYDPASGHSQKLSAESLLITNVESMVDSQGQLGLLMRLGHGDAPDDPVGFAVVSPAKGVVYREPLAELLARGDNEITVGFYHPLQFEHEFGEDGVALPRGPIEPLWKETLQLDEVLARPAQPLDPDTFLDSDEVWNRS
jgi:hypothetical protein